MELWNFSKINWIKLTIYILLVVGIYFIFNATVVSSFETYNNPFRFSLAHLFWVFVGLGFFIGVQKLEIKQLKGITWFLYLISILLLLSLAISKIWGCENPLGIAPCVNGAVRWFVLNPNPLPEIPMVGRITIQPSELGKISLILILSLFFSSVKLKDTQKIWYSLALALPIIGLVFIQPNKSTAFILFFIFLSIYISYGKHLKYLAGIVALGLIIFVSFVFINQYSFHRVAVFLSLEEGSSVDYHQNQIMISLGSGGIFGVGGGMSRQKFSYLPEVSSDSIFAVIGEELGLLGGASIIILFGILVFQGYVVAINEREPYFRFIATGVTSWIGVQSVINISSMVGLSPLTGVPLPLISYGGTSTLVVMVSLGILVKISKKHYGS